MGLRAVRMWGRELTLRQERLQSTLIFSMRLLALALPLYGIALFADLFPLQLLVADHSFLVLQALGLEPSRQGAEMAVQGFPFYISKDSTGWKSMVFFGALVFAVPGIAWRRRALGMLAGLPVLYLGNLGRVVGIVLAEQSYGRALALAVHDYLWSFGLIGLVLGSWLAWLRWAPAKGWRAG